MFFLFKETNTKINILSSKLILQSVGVKKGHNFTEARNACYLLDWSDAIIAEGRWDSSDPDLEVHGIPLGPDFMRVWVDVAVVPGAYLFRPNYAMLTIREVVGSTVAWPSQKVIPRGIYLVI